MPRWRKFVAQTFALAVGSPEKRRAASIQRYDACSFFAALFFICLLLLLLGRRVWLGGLWGHWTCLSGIQWGFTNPADRLLGSGAFRGVLSGPAGARRVFGQPCTSRRLAALLATGAIGAAGAPMMGLEPQCSSQLMRGSRVGVLRLQVFTRS